MMVEIIESTFVVPSEETPKVKLRLSNLEQVAPLAFTCLVYFYKNNEARDFFSIEVMKASLAKALVPFYPLAGRFVSGDDGRRMIDCNAEGALLVVARSDRSSDEISFEPSPELRKQFVPQVESLSLMKLFQVTYLKCGGVVLGSANNHLFDGRSVFNFFQTWAQIARGEIDSIVPPSFDNAQLRPRSPPTITFDHSEYASDDPIMKNTAAIPSSHFTIKLKLSDKHISSLKSQCIKESNTTRVSTFCAISALLWKCYCIAQELPSGTEAKLLFVADIRSRIRPPLPQCFLGNSVIRTSVTAEVSKITSNSIYVAADVVKAGIDRITDKYVRSFIDYVEVNLDKKMFAVMKHPNSVLRIGNFTGMPVYEADFGWGAPQLLTWAEASANNLIYLINDPQNNGVAAYVILDSDNTIRKFEKAFYKELYLLHSRL